MGVYDEFSLTDADALLRLIYSSPKGLVVVVAGQAVNFWAERYAEEEPQILAFRPFSSRDLDLFGEIANAYRLAQQTQGKIERPSKSAATPVLANIEVATGGLIRTVQFLRFVRGVTNREITNNAIPFERGDTKFYVSDPITMLKAKLHNLDELDQAGRNDERHVQILILCVPLFLKKQLLAADDTDAAARKSLRDLQRIIVLSEAPVARCAPRTSWSALLPIRELEKAKSARLRNFRDQQLKRWLDRIS